jgi:ribose 1,5-bisphosphokinase PhnN
MIGNDADTPVPVLVLTGPVGAGKTTVGAEVSDLLAEIGVAHAVIDVDCLRTCHPAPRDDPFHTALGLRNLAAVWANYRAAGAERLVLVDVVEERAYLAGYRGAIPGADITVVRLTATLESLHRRLEGRESGASLEWHKARAGELLAQMDERAVEDVLVQTEGKVAVEVAREVLARVGWTSAVR